ncbi:E3 ubiquitin-protein ligase Topors-like [Sinocyclocheilus grahami]|uniref:E3 ubiquitin-protein ligase Topors-like n=1 Tax=Sinocyclocheilus grahami TaxID=75366 RepID=UPI0007AC667F|nr:PREDICTED: E3 ubiquitin-protein ligase Topors-like [Sinocyclocheilus grahami]
MMAPSKMKLRVRKRDSAGKSSQRLLANASPDSKCPICLDGFNNVASLDRCLHQFCFRCIHEWSKNKAECPLCKQPFHSIIHSVKGENDFKEFVLRPPENGVPANADPPERVVRPRVLRSQERRSHRAQNPAPSSSPPQEDDVMFDGLTDAAALAENQDVQQMVLRLTARRHGRGEGRSLRRLRDQDVVAFRRALYRTGVRVRSSRDAGRQRDISAVFLRQNPGCLRRLLPWLQRELTVLYGSHGSLVNIVQNIIISRIMNYNMEDSAIRDELRPFLLARTDHFLHELVSFARSTLNMEVYDQQAVYDCPAPSYEEGSSSDLSVIAISEDDDDNDSEDNVTENPSAVQECLASVATASGVESLPSQSAWDDETPGPSYSTLLPSSSQSHGEGAEPSASTAPPLSALDMTDPVVSGRVSAGPGEDDEEEECLIVGYVKPMAERTPELVQLSSDSSEEEQEPATTETMASVTKSEASQVQLPLHSHMNPISPSSSPGSAPLCSPQHLHSDGVRSHSREQEVDYLSFRGHQSKDGSQSHSQQSRGDSRCRGHKRHRSHRRSGSKEKDKSLEQSRHVKTPDCSPSQTQSWTQSPAVSVWSVSPASKSHSSDCSPSRNKSGEHSRHARERFSHSPANSRRRRTKERRSRSPDLDSFLGSHHPCEAKRSRKRRKRSVSSSGADSHSEKSCLDKPSGKRKYKTRHLERAAQRQHKEGTTSKEKRHRERRRSRERSPSVEIIYEQKPPDPYWVQRRKRKHRKRRRELRSPTVITIDSDSDRTIDCLDRVMDVIDQTAADFEQRDETPKQESIQNSSYTLDSSNPLSEPSSPMGSSDPITERTLNLDDCVVDVVDHSSSDCSRNMGASNHQEFIPNHFPVDSIIMAPPSDVRLLETILQDLVDFLPGAEREMGRSSPGQQEPASRQQKDQSEI